MMTEFTDAGAVSGQAGGQASGTGSFSETQATSVLEEQEIPLGLPVSPEELKRLKLQAEEPSSHPGEGGQDGQVSHNKN